MPATDRFRNGPLSFYGADNPRTTGIMNVADAMRAGNTVMPWGPNSGVGPGSRGYMGSGVIGSAAGALGSAGIPTSQRGRYEKAGGGAEGEAAAEMPTWMLSQQSRQKYGLGQDWRYGGFGQLPYGPAPMPAPAAAQSPQSAPVAPAQPVQASPPWWNPAATLRNWLNPYGL